MTLAPASFLTASLERHPRGHDMAAILAAGVAAVDPYGAVRRELKLRDETLEVGSDAYDLRALDRLLVLAVGKAALPMARAALDLLGARITAGLVVPKAGDSVAPPKLGPLVVMPGAHPVPDERSVAAGQVTLDLLRGVGERDLVLALLSGGGSALITVPLDGLMLDDMRALTNTLLASGATINEINALRRRCDRVKGGGLARAAYPASVAALVLSDVVGDDLGAIASGPFVAEPAEAITPAGVVQRYGLHDRLPERVQQLLAEPASGDVDDAAFARVRHMIVGNVAVAAGAAAAEAGKRGFRTQIVTTTLRGEARDAGRELVRQLLSVAGDPPVCLIAGGETTVSIRGDGLGGRNQELALSCVEPLAGFGGIVVALATDGGDGPTDAAGAVVAGDTLERGRALGLEPDGFLRRNDAYHYFEPLGDLLMPGATETNVNDLICLFAC